MSVFDFDTQHERAKFSSSKWLKYPNRDILPFWVADMDFATPNFIIEAIQERLKHPVIGYTDEPEELLATFVDWAKRRYDWYVNPDWLVSFTSVVPGLSAAVASVGQDGDSSLVMTPIYPPFLDVAEINHRTRTDSALLLEHGRWVMDFDDIARQTANPSTTTLLLSNPQNPTGRVYTPNELLHLGEICVRNNTLVISDDIHWGLCLDRNLEHTPIASLNEEIANNTLTLISHTKSYNIAGLQSALAVIPNEDLRERFTEAKSGWMSGVSPLAYAAAIAAYADQSTWLEELQSYLRANRDLLETVVSECRGVSMGHVEGTHLAWLDARPLPLQDLARYFESHGLGLSDGVEFGAPGFVRFNFAAPRQLLELGLARLKTACECAMPS